MTSSAAERFAELVAELGARPGVTPPTGGRAFGASALKCDGSIFAMLQGGRLVVKLPTDRVAGLIAAGAGAAFSSGRGRSMRQWLVVADGQRWLPLAEEALQASPSLRRGGIDDPRAGD